MTSAADEELLKDFSRMYLSNKKAPEPGMQADDGGSDPYDSGVDMREQSEDWVCPIRHSQYTTNRHRRHSHYPFETKKLLDSLQQSSTNRCTKAKSRTEEKKPTMSSSPIGTKFSLRPSKLILKTPTSSYAFKPDLLRRRVRRQIRSSSLHDIPEDEDESLPSVSASEASSVPRLQQSCSQQATAHPDVNINELASYFDLYLHLPKKMSPMAEMMYN